MKCEKCSFRNKPYATWCKLCHAFLGQEYVTQMKERLNFIHYIRTGDYTSCQKYLESWETQGIAALSARINHTDDRFYTPIHFACEVNNTEIVKLLLKYKADPNVVVPHSFQTDVAGEMSWNMTTMHIAADHGNLEIMKLLIENRFNLHQMNICVMGGKTVFLILCDNGNIECLDYIISLRDGGNQNMYNNISNNPYVIDIFATDYRRRNGLNMAVQNDDLKMCEYLLKCVYHEQGLRDRIISNAVVKAAAQNTGQNCVSILKYLVEYKTSIFDDIESLRTILHGGAFWSWQVGAYMIKNKVIYTKCPSMFEKMVSRLLQGDSLVLMDPGRWKENHNKYMPLLWDFVSTRLSDGERLVYVGKLLISYFEFCDFEDDFHMFVDMLTLMLSRDNIKDWKYFYKSTTVMPYKVCKGVHMGLLLFNKEIDGRWKDLIRNMKIAYKDPNKWHNMSKRYNYSSDENDINIDDEFYHCTNHHVMVPFVLKKEKDEMGKECSKCNVIKDKMGYWCEECNEYICCDCGDMFELNQLLLNKKFRLFGMKIKKHNKDSRLLKKV